MSPIRRNSTPRPPLAKAALSTAPAAQRLTTARQPQRSVDTFTAARPTTLLSLSSPPPPPPAAAAPPAPRTADAPATGDVPLTPEQAAKQAADTLANYRAQLASGKKLEELDVPEADQNMAVFADALEQGATPEAIWTSPEFTDLYNKLKPEEQREVMSGAFSNQLRKNLLAQLKEQMDQAASEVERAMHSG